MTRTDVSVQEVKTQPQKQFLRLKRIAFTDRPADCLLNEGRLLAVIAVFLLIQSQGTGPLLCQCPVQHCAETAVGLDKAVALHDAVTLHHRDQRPVIPCADMGAAEAQKLINGHETSAVRPYAGESRDEIIVIGHRPSLNRRFPPSRPD